MNDRPSRRDFLAAGLALPAAVGSTTVPGLPAQVKPASAQPSSGGLSYRVLGKTGLKPTRVSFGCAITSDPSVIERAVDLGINYFDTSRRYQNGNNERMLGCRPEVSTQGRDDFHQDRRNKRQTRRCGTSTRA